MRALLLLLLSTAAAPAALAFSLGVVVPVFVESGKELVAAITNPDVSSVVVAQDVRFEPEDWPDGVYRLNRNLSLSSEPAGPHRVIDFNARSVQKKLSISPGFNWSFSHLTLKDTRYGAGADVDLLAPSPDGIWYLHDLAKLQYSCAPLKEAAILAYARDPAVPGTNVITFPKSLTWDNTTYYDNIRYVDFSTRMSVGENVAGAGYIVHKRDSVKLCSRVVDASCVARLDADTCIKQEMDAADLAAHPPPPQQGLSKAATAGIAAGVALAALAAAAAAVAALILLARRRRRQRQQQQQQAGVLPLHIKQSGGSGSSSGAGSSRIVWSKAGLAAATAGRSAAAAGAAAAGTHGSSPGSVSSFRIAAGSAAGSSCGGSSDHRGSMDTAGSARSSATYSHNSSQGIGQLSSAGPGSGWRPGLLGSGGSGGSTCLASLAMPDMLRSTLSREEAATISLGMMVGAGSFGRVFCGRLGSEVVAIKVIQHSNRAAQQVSNEVELMLRFDHQNLVRAHHYVTWAMSGVSLRLTRPDVADDSCRLPSVALGASGGEPPASNASLLETWIITKFCNAGNLQDAVLGHGQGTFFHQPGVPRVALMLDVLLGVARGMAWLHDSNTLHGDLKAANVMLSVEPFAGSAEEAAALGVAGPGGATLQLLPQVADFGLSRVMADGATHLSTFTAGTITHQPPELMRHGRLSKPADVFSMGVLMWEVIMAQQPWKGRMMGEIMTAVMIEGARLQFGPSVPEAYAELARACWAADPAARPTFHELVERLQLLQQQAMAAPACAQAQPAAAPDLTDIWTGEVLY